MTANDHRLPLLPLVLDDVPEGLRLALSQEGVPCRPRTSGWSLGRIVLFDSSRRPPPHLRRGQVGVDVHALRAGWSQDPFDMLLDETSAPCRWTLGRMQLSEEVARFDKREIRRRLMDSLRRAVEAVGGIWLRVSPYPFPYRSALNFRIDYDEYSARDFAATIEAIEGHDDAVSHFVSGSAYASHTDALACLRGRDVGSHGYWHHTYRDRDDNRENIRRGIEVLRRAGIEPSGFVAPHGRFNRGLLSALESLGVSHSSEFGLAYDELPFRPLDADALQVPVHPVCLGLFLDAARTLTAPAMSQEEAAALAGEYFAHLSQEKYDAGEPIFLYGHPTRRLGRFPHVLRRLFEHTAGFGALWKTTLTQYAEWWRAREAVRLRVLDEGGRYLVVTEHAPKGHLFAVEYQREKHVAVLPLHHPTTRFAPTALGYERRRPQRLTTPHRADGAHGLRELVRRYLDWERVTPLEELPTRTVRHRMKRALRRWMD